MADISKSDQNDGQNVTDSKELASPLESKSDYVENAPPYPDLADPNINITRIEPVGEPYREVCLSPWKGNCRMS